MTNEEKLVKIMRECNCYQGYAALNHRFYGTMYTYVFYNIITENLFILEDLDDRFENYDIKWFMDDNAVTALGDAIYKGSKNNE